MRRFLARFFLVLGIASLAVCPVLSAVPVASRTRFFHTSAGTVSITPLYHGSMRIEAGNKIIYLDPARPFEFKTAPKADLILITANDKEHLDKSVVTTLSQSGTEMISPLDVAKTFRTVWPISYGENKTWHGWTIEAVPNYNLKMFHPLAEFGYEKGLHRKGSANGYVLTYGDMRFYFSGDSDDVPEIWTLKNIDVAFVRMSFPHSNEATGAAWGALVFRPKIVVPYEYRESELGDFKKQLDRTAVEVHELEK